MISAVSARDWRSVSVSDLISISHGFAFKGEYFSEYGRDAVTTPGNFLESGGFRHTGAKQRYYSGNVPGSYRLDAGDLIVAMTEQADGLLGSTAWVPGEGRWLHNQRIGRIRAKRDDVSLKYLYYMFNSFEFRKAVAETAVGTKVKHTSPAKLGAVEILLPPREEQDQIAEVLSDADEHIEGLECLISKKEAVKQGIMQQLLVGRTRLPGFAEPWRTCSLSDMLTYEQPGRYLVQTTKQLDAGRVPVLTAGKTFVLGFTNESYGIYKAHPVVIFDDFTTASKYVDFDFKAKSSAMKILSPKEGVNLRFIYERMQLIDFPLGDHKRYWISEYSKQDLLVPSEEEQAAVAQVLADADDEIDALKARVEKARSVKQGMMQELLTGRTRLPVQGEDDE
ncbi:restriction endonuclease subunit S [Streptomyces tendae]|uniref:restriction endonuclease subunit S n=1 Tax=Streptomyces tendae TaxID=1932 RepID=UPI0033B90F38